MKNNTFFAIVFCLAILTAVQTTAGGRGLEVRPAEEELLGTRPKEIVSTTFRVTNTTSQQYEFISDVELPKGWTLITEDFPFDLSGNESTTKLVSFFVPETTAAGTYKISYAVSARKYPELRDFYTVYVVVFQSSKEVKERSKTIPPQAKKKGLNQDSNSPITGGQSLSNLRLVSGLKDAKESLETEPRQTITAAFRVTNPTNEKREFISEVKLPIGWILIGKDFPFELNPNESDTKLVSFFVPQTTLAGRYEITYTIKDRKYSAIHDFYTIDVIVKQLNKLQVKLLESPKFVIAGEKYQSSFVVTNHGNIERAINIKVGNKEKIPYVISDEKFTLAPGQSKTVTVTAKSDAKIAAVLNHHLQLTAESVDDSETKTKAQAESIVEIIPKINGVEDNYHRIPAAAIFRYVSEKNNDRTSGFQTEFRGEGTLDEEGKKHVKFDFRGPDIQNKSVFGERDEYLFSYWTKDHELHFGDRSYSLSSLTENYLYGRGVEGKANIDNVTLGAYHMQTQWLEPGTEETAAYMDYQINEKCKVGLNYLRKLSGGKVSDITSFEGELKPFKDTEVDVEYALGPGGDSKSDAYLTKLYGRNNWLNYYLKLTHAGPDYPGYYKNLDYISGGLTIPIEKHLKLNASFRQEKENLDLDPTLDSAPLEMYYQLGVDYKFETNTTFSWDWLSRDRKDRLESPKFDYQENTSRFGVGQSFDKLTLYSSVELGKTENDLDHTTSDLERYTASINFTPNNKQSYSGYVYYDKNSDFTGEKRRSTTIGLTARYQIADKTSLNLMLQTNDYQGSAQGGRDNAELELSHTFPNDNRLSITARHTRYQDSTSNDDTALMVQYTIPLGLPVGRKKSAGSIKGYLYDQETQNAIGNAILRLNGSTAVTDKAGNFIFPSVRPGVYYLNVDTASIGMNRIPTEKAPIELAVEGGKATSVDIAVTRAARLSGQIMVYNYKRDHDKISLNKQPGDINELYVAGNSSSNINTKLVEDCGLANTIVELKCSSEIRRTVTNLQGHFEFEELRPDKWTFKIYSDNLPEYHYLEEDIFELELKPDQKKEIFAKVLPKERRIRIIGKPQTLREEKQK
jgi:hypothetical protein